MLTGLLHCNITRRSAVVAAVASLMLVGTAAAQSHHPAATTAAAPEVAPPAAQVPEALMVEPVAAAEQDYLVRDFVLIESAEIDQYLRSVEDKLLQAAKATIPAPRLVVFSADEFDVQTDANGIIMISSGTLRALESEDELAALLGHELTHALLKHPGTRTLLSRFPAGFEAAGLVAATAGQQTAVTSQAVAATQGKPAGSTPPSAMTFAAQSLQTSSDTSLFWSDLLAPSWNRNQERQADHKGSELMEAAGYDWTAFNTLLDKMHDAQEKRSARLRQLRQKMIERAQQQATAAANGGKPSPAGGVNPMDLLPPGGLPTPSALLSPTYLTRIGGILVNYSANIVPEKAVNGIFDQVDKETKDYDSPDERRRLLAEYHSSASAPPGNLKPRSLGSAGVLQSGRGGALMKADTAALQTLAALESGDVAKADTAAAALLPASKPEPPKVDSAPHHSSKSRTAKSPKSPSESSPKRAPGEQQKPTDEPSTQLAAEDPASLSPHLNFALARWYLQHQKNDQAEIAAVRWINFAYAPLQAFKLRAAAQADRKEFSQAIITLKDGERRLGTTLPFLPLLVTYARGAEDLKQAELFAHQCKDEEHKQASTISRVSSLFGSKVGPVYADCMLRLGYDPDKPPAQLNAASHDPAPQPVSPPISQSVSQPVPQPVTQPASQPISQPTSQPVTALNPSAGH